MARRKTRGVQKRTLRGRAAAQEAEELQTIVHTDIDKLNDIAPVTNIKARAESPKSRVDNSLDDIMTVPEVELGGRNCELHDYERRFDPNGDAVTLRVGTRSAVPLDKERSHEAGLVVTRDYNHNRSLRRTVLDIQSPHIMKALKDVVQFDPGVTNNLTERITFIDEPRCLFHHRHALQAFAEKSHDPDVKSHIDLCLQYMEKALEKQIAAYNLTFRDVLANPSLEYLNLWMASKPGEIIYRKVDGVENLHRLESMELEDIPGPAQSCWLLNTVLNAYSKGRIGKVRFILVIPKYEGCKPITQLGAFPLELHPEKERVKDELLQRGKRFVSLLGVEHKFYEGVAEFYPTAQGTKPTWLHIRNRIMLDRISDNDGPSDFLPNTISIAVIPGEKVDIVDNDLLLCSAYLHGYSLVHKLWGWFNVSKIQDIQFNEAAFTDLVLPAPKKDLISKLVANSDDETDCFDDLIKGKGKGLIFLLHGLPGLGKTYTAESIADKTKRPLLMVSSGEIIGPACSVERRLKDIFDLATRWKAIVLLDEADVFMQQRTTRDLERNSLVSCLLRIVEYFEGTLFLTTNRFETIDSAFKSRTQVAISYPKLSEDAKKQLWRTSITRACGDKTPAWLNTRFLDQVAQTQVNGREIKNIVSVAQKLARSSKHVMQPEQIFQGITALIAFDTEVNGINPLNDFEGRDVRRASGLESVGIMGKIIRAFTSPRFLKDA